MQKAHTERYLSDISEFQTVTENSKTSPRKKKRDYLKNSKIHLLIQSSHMQQQILEDRGEMPSKF